MTVLLHTFNLQKGVNSHSSTDIWEKLLRKMCDVL